MSQIPAYAAAVSGQPGNAGQVNQLLGAHTSLVAYGVGTVQASQTTASTSYQTTAGQWLAQQFMTGGVQTAIGQVRLQLSTVGGSPTSAVIPPLTLSLYADLGGLPTGSALASVIVNEEWIYSAPYWVTLPLMATGLTPGTFYQLVVSPVGTSSQYYVWHQSNQIAGSSTSSDGVTWTASSYGLVYQVFDNAGAGVLPTLITGDNGQRWTQFTYTAQGLPATVTEFTAAQNGSSSYLYSTRSLTYSGGLLTGVN